MKVVVRSYGDIKRILNSDKLTVDLRDGAKIRDLISKLGGRVESSGRAFMGTYELKGSSLAVLVNGRNINALNGIDTTLKEGDVVTFMPVLVGG